MRLLYTWLSEGCITACSTCMPGQIINEEFHDAFCSRLGARQLLGPHLLGCFIPMTCAQHLAQRRLSQACSACITYLCLSLWAYACCLPPLYCSISTDPKKEIGVAAAPLRVILQAYRSVCCMLCKARVRVQAYVGMRKCRSRHCCMTDQRHNSWATGQPPAASFRLMGSSKWEEEGPGLWDGCAVAGVAVAARQVSGVVAGPLGSCGQPGL